MSAPHEEIPAEQSPNVWVEAYPQLLELGISTDIHERAGQVAAISGEGLMDIITKVHTAVAPEYEHTPSEVARSVVQPDGTITRELLQPEERQPLLNHAAELVAEMAAMRQSPEDDAPFLRRAGNVMALGVVMTHNFVDGNGRTARTVGQLVREGFDAANQESVNDMQALSGNRTNVGFRINSYWPTNAGIQLSATELLSVAAAIDIPLQDEAAYQQQKGDAFTTPYA